MRLSDEELGRLYGEGAGGAAAPAGDCPDPEAMVRWMEAEAGEAEQLRIADHVSSCPQCWREVEALRALRTATGRGRVVRPSWWRSGAGRTVAAAAAVVLLAAGGVGLWLELRPPRFPTGSDALRSSARPLRPLAPPREVNEAPASFRWEPVEGAAAYRFTLRASDLFEVLHREETATPEVRLPDAVAARLQSGATYFWEVRALRKEGEAVRSEVLSFRIR